MMSDMPEWRCCGCGKVSPDKKANCKCPTGCLFVRGGHKQIALKVYPDSTSHHTAEIEKRDRAIEVARADMLGIAEQLEKTMVRLRNAEYKLEQAILGDTE